MPATREVGDDLPGVELRQRFPPRRQAVRMTPVPAASTDKAGYDDVVLFFRVTFHVLSRLLPAVVVNGVPS